MVVRKWAKCKCISNINSSTINFLQDFFHILYFHLLRAEDWNTVSFYLYIIKWRDRSLSTVSVSFIEYNTMPLILSLLKVQVIVVRNGKDAYWFREATPACCGSCSPSASPSTCVGSNPPPSWLGISCCRQHRSITKDINAANKTKSKLRIISYVAFNSLKILKIRHNYQ